MLDFNNISILVVEDDPDMRVFLSNLLTSSGFCATCTENIEQGLKIAEEQNPFVIIIDAMLPEEAGVRFYWSLRLNRRLKNIPVIMLSSIERKTFFRLRKYQASRLNLTINEPEAYLQKPPEAEELLRVVRRLFFLHRGAGECTP